MVLVAKDGTYPVMGRITVDGTQCQFSCKVNCSPDLWEIKGGRAIGKSVMARNVNMELDKIKARIDKYYKEIVERVLRRCIRGKMTLQSS